MTRSASGPTEFTASATTTASSPALVHTLQITNLPQERVTDVITIGLAEADRKLREDSLGAWHCNGTTHRVVAYFCLVKRRSRGKSWQIHFVFSSRFLKS
jgi:hypothetical protein